MPRPRESGAGSVFRRPDSRFWWIGYRVAGRTVQESTKTTKDFKHCGEKGIKLDPEFEKLRDALIEYTRTNGKHLIISFCSKDDMAQNTIMCSRAFLMNFCGDVVKDLMEGQM